LIKTPQAQLLEGLSISLPQSYESVRFQRDFKVEMPATGFRNRHIAAILQHVFTFVAQAVAWLTLGFVMIATLTPVSSRASICVAGYEGVFLSGLMGFLFIAAYPDDRRIIALLCVFAVIASEGFGVIFPRRPPGVEGTVVKILGGVLMQFPG
jgi:hypothetical protein